MSTSNRIDCIQHPLFVFSQFFRILHSPLLLSDSCLHLFLQSQLSISKMEACAAGRTHYSVAQAVQCCGLRRFHFNEDLQKDLSVSCDSDSDRYSHTLRIPVRKVSLHSNVKLKNK